MAGYSCKWSDPVTKDSTTVLVSDVRIYDWHRPSNAKPEQPVPDLPPSHFWASARLAVGWIYTAQDLEYDWAGVIFGNDFVWRDDRWDARRVRSHDPAVKQAAGLHFARLIRNTYQVLLTRDMCVFVCIPRARRLRTTCAR